MNTYFASPERAEKAELQHQIEAVSQNPVMDGLLEVVGGLLAVLNEHRQILAVNEALLTVLGIGDAQEILSLRPGEALHCVHAHEMPGGCGTSQTCATCGAAIAMVTSLEQDHPVEKICVLKTKQNGKEMDLVFSVRSHPIRIGSTRFLLLFLQDITQPQQWASLERLFLHDINNLLQGILGESEMLKQASPDEAAASAEAIHQISLRLTQEVALQQCLIRKDLSGYHAAPSQVSLNQVASELRHIFAKHAAARDKMLHIELAAPELAFRTDMNLLLRILGNMITNALEASATDEAVKVTLGQTADSVTFQVWNRRLIPDDIARRVFQRNFSTKEGMGRGLGTYSMKLFGEQLLGGQVSFQSSPLAGTTFQFILPRTQSAR